MLHPAIRARGRKAVATIVGTSGNDTIQPSGVSPGVTGGVPGGGFDQILGSGGNDRIVGGGGFDALDYSGFLAANAITVAWNPLGFGTVGKAGLGTDTVSGVAQIHGTPGADRLTVAADDANLGG